MSLRSPAALLRRSTRNADYGRLQETFLVAAIATILIIRTQLWLTNYPQLGGGGLHIAHLLYGGIFMAAAIGIAITLLGRRPRLAAAVLGGVGFGFFIDELGKFITSDNDYFFEPAAALIYLIFIGIFMLMRWMRGLGQLSPAERLANAIDFAADAARHPLDHEQKRRALELLDGADQTDPLTPRVRELLAEIDAVPASEPSWPVRAAAAVRARYLDLVRQRGFQRLVVAVFGLWALGSVLLVLELALSLVFTIGGAMPGFASDQFDQLSFLNWASMVSSIVSAGFVAAGVLRLRAGDRAAAYRRFERGLLIAILVTRVFAFVESQFGAVIGLSVDLLLLLTVRYMARQEELVGGEGGGGALPGGGGAVATAPAPAPEVAVPRGSAR